MRRRLEVFIPIVLLAVLVQLIAPIAAFRAVASAVSDPLCMTSICSEMAPSQDAQSTPSAPRNHGDCCAFCGAGHGGSVAVDPPPLIFVVSPQLVRLPGRNATMAEFASVMQRAALD